MKKKTVLITGASRGLGLALAQTFAEHDYNLILHSKEREIPIIKKGFCFTREKNKDYGVYCETVTGDIRRMSTVFQLNNIAEEMGGVDVLINNAGMHRGAGIGEVDSIVYKEMIDVNLTAPMIITKELWEQVKRKQGLFIFINSIAGKVGADKEFMYCASKHGLKGFADSIQFDATRNGVKVLSVYLGALKTDMSKHRNNYDKLTDPEEAANFIYHTAKDYRTMRITEVDVCRRIYE